MVLPLSGSEDKFTARLWGAPPGITSNNCYDYAVGDYAAYRRQKSAPGARTSAPDPSLHCADLMRRALADNPGRSYRPPSPETACKPGFYKIFMVATKPGRRGPAPGKDGDFHFYKQHGVVGYRVAAGDTMASLARFFAVPRSRIAAAARNAGGFRAGKDLTFVANCWSHKRGWATGPLLIDARGAPIRDPRTAARDYGPKGRNYELVCGALCVRAGAARAGATAARAPWPVARRTAPAPRRRGG